MSVEAVSLFLHCERYFMKASSLVVLVATFLVSDEHLLFAGQGKRIRVVQKQRGFMRKNDPSNQILLAAERSTRRKSINTTGRSRGGDQTSIDFDEVDITGSRKAPVGSMINQNKADKDYDFVPIRRKWHPEMFQSATTLDLEID